MKNLIIRWSKKENDWICNYPNRNGKILGYNIFTMIKDFENMEGKKLRQTIIDSGFNPDSFKIEIKINQSNK